MNIPEIINGATGIAIDSRKVAQGYIFVAIRGTQVDGHNYIAKAIEQGATTIVCETLPSVKVEGVRYVQVENTETMVGSLATAFYGNPTAHLKLVGVTGTNGKTTIATLLYHTFRALGYKVGLISTVCNYIDGEAIPTEHTTPDPITLNQLLSDMVRKGCSYAFMEVSSHAVVQGRIGGLQFVGGIFTNLTRDHLDYHKTFDQYLAAKKGFFDGLPATAFALANADDKHGKVMVQNTAAHIAYYALQTLCEYKGTILESHFDGMALTMGGHELHLQFIGKFNALNLLAVYGAACLLGAPSDEVLRILTTLRPVAGRFDAIRSPKGFTAIVDYAHTPDAIDNVLAAIHGVIPSNSTAQVITVVGAGGNRDKGKRPLMAIEAVKQSHRVIITSDNPRFEEPQAIINDMLAGLSADQRRKVLTIVDRREAIRTACALARKDDVILVAGKGHEDYQDVQGVKHHFDDREELRNCFNEMN